MPRPSVLRTTALLLAATATTLAAQMNADAPVPGPAVRTVEDSVVAVVKGLFDGMRARDTALIRRSFATGTNLGGVPPQGRPASFVPVDAFLKSIASAPPGVLLDERIFDPEVRVDGGLATVWTFYQLWVGDRMSHCGVDAFQLARTGTGWSIIGLADSRRTTDCDAAGKRPA